LAAIIELLLKIQLVDDRQHDAVMSRSRSGSGGHIVQQVAELGYATEGTVARAISVELGLPRIDLRMTPPEPAALELLDARTCAERFVLPVALRENGELLWLAMADPTDEETINLVRRKSNKRVRPAVAGPSEILRAVRLLYAAAAEAAAQDHGPKAAQPSEMRAIELNDEAGEEDDAFEVVNVSEELGSPLARLAAQLGVSLPEKLSSGRPVPRELGPVEIDLEGVGDDERENMVDARPAAPQRSIPPQGAAQGLPRPPSSATSRLRERKPKSGPSLVRAPAQSRPPDVVTEVKDLLTPLTHPGPIDDNDLTAEDLQSLEALSQSMEKGALVLRALAELCVEKSVFTREEMRHKNKH